MLSMIALALRNALGAFTLYTFVHPWGRFYKQASAYLLWPRERLEISHFGKHRFGQGLLHVSCMCATDVPHLCGDKC
jgi:hypothetical protein